MEKTQNRFLVSIFNPLLKSSHFFSEHFISLKNWFFCWGDICQENKNLKDQLQSKSLRLMELESILQTQKNWDKIQNFSLFSTYEKIPAKVLACNPSDLIQTLRINVGKKQSIALGDPVIVPEGLVGIVSEVYEDSSVVMLVTDTHFQASASLKNKVQKGLMKGFHKKMDFDRYFAMNRLEYLQNSSDIQEGDEAQTSGLDGFFPTGIPLGKISKVLRDEKNSFLNAEVIPAVDFFSLDGVLVLRRSIEIGLNYKLEFRRF
ncbi:MAG: rod shape-determining protein MreC [Deltaproteobacteria bacterium]|nr:rod shape-determining protein MreC [Deltaproteobacteria bacterium]